MLDENMLLLLTDFTEQDAMTVCNWVYEDEYSVYNSPSWNTVKEQRWGMADEKKRNSQFRKIVDQHNNYIGYFRFYPVDNKVMLGLGMNPKFCGRHLGPVFVYSIIKYIEVVYHDMPIELEVRSFNQRAVKCYERCGFKMRGKRYKETPIGNDEFIIMQYHHE